MPESVGFDGAGVDGALPRRDWLARLLRIMEDERVGAAGGRMFDADGRVLQHPVSLDGVALDAWPLWSRSNHASGWRAEAWRRPLN